MSRREQPIADPDIMTAAEVMKWLRISRNTLYDACGRNQIPHVRIGRILRFSRAALVRWSSPWSSHVAKGGQ